MARVIGTWPRWLAVAAAGVIALVTTALGLFSAEILRELNGLKASPRDNVQWSLAQAEVEHLVFADAVDAAMRGSGGLDEVRKRFDILYSRTGILAQSDLFEAVRQRTPSAEAIGDLRRRLDALIPIIDSPDAELRARLPVLMAEADDLRPVVRTIALDSLKLFAAQSDARRAAFARLIVETAAVALVLIVLLAIVVLLVLHQKKVSMERARALQQSGQRFQATIEASLNAVIIADETGRIIHFNPAAETTFGYPREVAVGADLATLIIPPDQREAHQADMARYRKTGHGKIIGRSRVELTALHSSGRELPVEMSLSAIEGPEGRLFIAFARDITDRLEAERALTEARDEALAVARAKSEFLAVMSHEMRTPLNGVMALLDLLGETGLDARQRRYLETAVASGELLQHHIDDVLDINRMEAGLLALRPGPVDLHALVNEIVRMNEPAAEARHNRIAAQVDLPPAPILADRHRLGQMLLNLVGNAVKFTEGGRIAITAREDRGEDGEPVLEIAVSDTGIGIAEADRDRIFEDFVTLDPSYRRSAGGYGLGLGICRRIVETMEGTIDVESAVGQGSRFVVRIPLRFAAHTSGNAAPPQPGASPPSEAPCAAEATPLGVLVVEDNETNRFAAGEMLRSEGCRVSEACDGLAGLASAERARFDLILMDISMPRLDGIEAARRIRAGDGLSKETPIVALTAHAQPEERERVREAGMQDLLTKPLRRQAVACLIARVRAGTIGDGPEALLECPEAAERSRTATLVDAMPGLDDEVIDGAVLGELAEVLDPAEFERRVTAFRAELEGLADALAATWSGGSLCELRDHAHRANGSAALFGAVHLNDVLGTLEEACMDCEPEFVDPLLDELRRAAERTRRALDAVAPPRAPAPAAVRADVRAPAVCNG